MLHGKAFFTAAPHDTGLRAGCGPSKESTRALSTRYGASSKAVDKGRKQSTTTDAPMKPKDRGPGC